MRAVSILLVVLCLTIACPAWTAEIPQFLNEDGDCDLRFDDIVQMDRIIDGAANTIYDGYFSGASSAFVFEKLDETAAIARQLEECAVINAARNGDRAQEGNDPHIALATAMSLNVKRIYAMSAYFKTIEDGDDSVTDIAASHYRVANGAYREALHRAESAWSKVPKSKC